MVYFLKQVTSVHTGNNSLGWDRLFIPCIALDQLKNLTPTQTQTTITHLTSSQGEHSLYLKGTQDYSIHTLSLTPLLPSPSLSVYSSSLVPFIIIIVILTIVLTIIIIFILIIGGAIKSSKASQNLGRASYFKGTEGVHFYIWVEFKIISSSSSSSPSSSSSSSSKDLSLALLVGRAPLPG